MRRTETPRELVERLRGPGLYERHEQVQAQLKARSEALKRWADERRRAAGAER